MMPPGHDALAEVRKLLRQQAAIAQFGRFAIGSTSRKQLLHEAVRACSEALNSQFCVIFRHRKKENDFIVESSTGWSKSLVGEIIPKTNDNSPQMQAFASMNPLIVTNLEDALKFTPSQIYAKYKIVSMADVVIPGGKTPYGVLEVANMNERRYDEDEVVFLTSFTDILGNAILKSDNVRLLKDTIQKMKKIIDEKSRRIEKSRV